MKQIAWTNWTNSSSEKESELKKNLMEYNQSTADFTNPI